MNLWRALFPKQDDALARSYRRADRLRWWYYGLGWADATKFIQRTLDEGRATWPNGTLSISKTLLIRRRLTPDTCTPPGPLPPPS